MKIGLFIKKGVSIIILVSLLLQPISTFSATGNSAIDFIAHDIDLKFDGNTDWNNPGVSTGVIDIDKDGDLDIIGAARNDCYIALLKNDGNLNFTKQIINNSICEILDLALGDVNNDNWIDIVVVTLDYDNWGEGKTIWLENKMGSNFVPHLISGIGYESLDVGDMDNDGDLDVVTHGQFNSWREFVYFENLGGGSFQKHILDDYDYYSVESLVVVDLDKDRDLDIVFSDNEIYWFENLGSDNFQDKVIIDEHDFDYGLAVGDLDNDNDNDIAFTQFYRDKIGWIENKGNNTFEIHYIDYKYEYPMTIAIADLNHDGYSDLLSGGYINAWWENDKHGGFIKHLFLNYSQPLQYDIYPIDLDKDTDTDFVSNSWYSIHWWENIPFQPDIEIDSGTLIFSPSTPEILNTIFIMGDFENIGSKYVPTKNEYDVFIYLRNTNNGDEYLLIWSDEITELDTHESKTFLIEDVLIPFWINEIEVCVYLKDQETNITNNCVKKTISVISASSEWRKCAGMGFSGLSLFIELLPVDKAYEVIKGLSNLLFVKVPNVMVQCTANDKNCFKEIANFLIDSALLAAQILIENTFLAIVNIFRSIITHFNNSFECGGYLYKLLHEMVVSASNKEQKINVIASDKILRIRLMDSLGRWSGIQKDGTIISQIPNSYLFNDNGYTSIIVPDVNVKRIELNTTMTNYYELNLSVFPTNSSIKSMTYRDVYMTSNTSGFINLENINISTENMNRINTYDSCPPYTLCLDDNNDAIVDRFIQPSAILTEKLPSKVFLPLLKR